MLLGVYTSLVFADPPVIDKEQLLRFAEADGARIALGRICKLPEADIITLGNKQEALTLAIAKRNSIELDSKTYVEAAKLGLRSTVELVTLISPNKKSYKENCREVRATFMKNLVAFDLYLSDSPGIDGRPYAFGHAYAFTEWMIVTGKQQPRGMAMVDDEQVLVSGMTDLEGHIVLDEKQQKR